MTKQPIISILSWIVLAVIIIYFAYSKGWILADFESIAPKEAYTILQNDKDVFLLDVRTQEEYSQEHIEGATLIPVQVLAENISKLKESKYKKIIVYCHSGNRSVTASRVLAKNGFTPLNLKGGITQWKNEGFSVIR